MENPTIESYDERPEGVERVEQHHVVIHAGANRPEIDEAIRFSKPGGGAVYGRVTRYLGQRQIEVQLLRPVDWLDTSARVEFSGELAGLTGPRPGMTRWEELSLAPASHPDVLPWKASMPPLATLSGVRTPLSTGRRGLDLIAAPVAGGVNLVLDGSDDGAAFHRLLDAARPTTSTTVAIISHERDAQGWDYAICADDDYGYGVALKAGLLWVGELRQRTDELLFVAELPLSRAEEAQPDPAAGSAGEIVDLLGANLVSTRNCRVTSFLRLPIGGLPGWGDIAETLSLGDVDAQIVLDSNGAVDLRRSTSRAPLAADDLAAQQRALSTLARAEKARERAQLWGEDELEPEEIEALGEADALRVVL